jgi:hypothetical protein
MAQSSTTQERNSPTSARWAQSLVTTHYIPTLVISIQFDFCNPATSDYFFYHFSTLAPQNTAVFCLHASCVYKQSGRRTVGHLVDLDGQASRICGSHVCDVISWTVHHPGQYIIQRHAIVGLLLKIGQLQSVNSSPINVNSWQGGFCTFPCTCSSNINHDTYKPTLAIFLDLV